MRSSTHPTPRARIRLLYRLARLALREYGVRDSRLVILQDERETLFRVMGRSHDARRGNSGRFERFVLRLDRSGYSNPDHVLSRFEWMRAIRRDTGLIVPEPVPSGNGEYLVRLEVDDLSQSVICSLTRWVDGKLRLLPTGPGPDALHAVGRFMATLHDHAESYWPPGWTRFPVWDGDGLFGRSSCFFPKDGLQGVDSGSCRLLKTVERRAREAMARLGKASAVFGLIHADLIQVNYLFHKGQVRAVDFGDCGYGYYLYDIGVTLLMLRGFDPDGSQRAAFLRGYRQVRALSEEYEAMVPLFTAARAAAFVRWMMGNGAMRTDHARAWSADALAWVKEWAGR